MNSSDNPLDFYSEILLPIIWKYLYIGWNTK